MNKYKELRKKKGLTQIELANKLNVTQASVSRWENDNLNVLPDYPTLLELSKLYGVSVDYLLGNSTELTTTSTALTPEQAKDIWFASLPQEDQETINLYLMLSYSDRLRVNGYILSRLNN